ncbi:MAG: RidA family protein [bacterium]
MTRTALSMRMLFLFVMIAFDSYVVAADKPEIYPSSKYPDYPFSEAVAYSGVLYLSGDIGTGTDGKLVEGGIVPESRQTMENIKATLNRHGLGMESIIKCTVFLADISEWPAFNEIYAGYFQQGKYPARSALAASGLALGARVELECIAALQSINHS